MQAVQPNEYAMMGGYGGSRSIKQATIEVRRGFVRKVYSILTAQIIITVAIAWPLQGQSLYWLQQHNWMIMASLFGSLVTLCSLSCCADVTRKFPQNFMLLFTFTVFEAILVGFVSAMYTAGSVATAAAATIVIFTGLTFYACFTKTDCTEYGIYLFGAMMCLMAFGLMLMLLNAFGIQTPMMVKLYQLGGMFIFSMFVIYDTQKIMGEWGGHKTEFSVDDYVIAALNIYLDVVQLFMYILELIGTRKD